MPPQTRQLSVVQSTPPSPASLAADAQSTAHSHALLAARYALDHALETAAILRETLSCADSLGSTFLSDLPRLAHAIELAVMRMDIALKGRGRVR